MPHEKGKFKGIFFGLDDVNSKQQSTLEQCEYIIGGVSTQQKGLLFSHTTSRRPFQGLSAETLEKFFSGSLKTCTLQRDA